MNCSRKILVVFSFIFFALCNLGSRNTGQHTLNYRVENNTSITKRDRAVNHLEGLKGVLTKTQVVLERSQEKERNRYDGFNNCIYWFDFFKLLAVQVH